MLPYMVAQQQKKQEGVGESVGVYFGFAGFQGFGWFLGFFGGGCLVGCSLPEPPEISEL